MEYRIHTHASYATCETEDYLRIAGSYTPKLAADKNAQAELVPEFFRLPANDSDGDPLWAGCQSRPMQVRCPCEASTTAGLEKRHQLHGFERASVSQRRSRMEHAVRTHAHGRGRCVSCASLHDGVERYECSPEQATACLQIHYMYGALFKQQSRHLRQWIEDDEASGPKPVKKDFIVSVMFWTSTPFVSPASPTMHWPACLPHAVDVAL